MSKSLNFQVNLQGMIELLSNHLYTNPGVFIRELLQNGIDAVTARKKLGNAFDPRVSVELHGSRTLAVYDNGIGLTEEEIHQFLSQIGHTSKRNNPDGPDDYIGQFGVGLLACFVVSNEIVVITRSAKEGSVTLEWRGRPDGTYSLRELEQQAPVGTTVYLTCKENFEEYFEFSQIEQLMIQYGSFLPVPIYIDNGRYDYRINEKVAPWDMTRSEALEYGRALLNTSCLDVIELRSTIGEVKGIAYILPYAVSLQAERQHHVYLKNMLIANGPSNILPPWAFFVTCIVNTTALRPTASREAFYENDMLLAVQDELGACIKNHLIHLAEHNPELLQRIVRVHYMSLKAMAVEDNELYRLFIPYLSFETSLGMMEAQEIIASGKPVLLTTTLDEFRQISRVAKAQELLVVNGGYMHDFDLIRSLAVTYPGVAVEVVDSVGFFKRFRELEREDMRQAAPFLRQADETLRKFQCSTAIRSFEPADIPVMYTTNEEITFLRMAESSSQQVNEMFADIVNIVRNEIYELPMAKLCFNYNNPTIREVLDCPDTDLRRLSIEMLYTQSLLMGNYPLSQEELKLMNTSFMSFLKLGLNRTGGGPIQ